MNKLILALCFTTGKVAGFASYSGKECVLEESCQAASNVDGFDALLLDPRWSDGRRARLHKEPI